MTKNHFIFSLFGLVFPLLRRATILYKETMERVLDELKRVAKEEAWKEMDKEKKLFENQIKDLEARSAHRDEEIAQLEAKVKGLMTENEERRKLIAKKSHELNQATATAKGWEGYCKEWISRLKGGCALVEKNKNGPGEKIDVESETTALSKNSTASPKKCIVHSIVGKKTNPQGK